TGCMSTGQTGQMDAKCQVKKTDTLAMSDRSPLGFSGKDLLALIQQKRTATLVWKKGGTTEVTLEASSKATTARYTATDYCGDTLAVDAELAFSTKDGAFNEAWPMTVGATARDSAMAGVDIDTTTLKGSYKITEFDPKAYESSSLGLSLQYEGSGLRGDIIGYAKTHPNADGKGGRIRIPIATFCVDACPPSMTQ